MTSRSNAAPGRFGLLDVVVLIAMAVTATAFAAGLIINSGIDMMAGVIAGAALFIVMASSHYVITRQARSATVAGRLDELEEALVVLDGDLQRIDQVEDDVARLDLLTDRVERLDQAISEYGGGAPATGVSGPVVEHLTQDVEQLRGRLDVLRSDFAAQTRAQRDEIGAELKSLEGLIKDLSRELMAASPAFAAAATEDLTETSELPLRLEERLERVSLAELGDQPAGDDDASMSLPPMTPLPARRWWSPSKRSFSSPSLRRSPMKSSSSCPSRQRPPPISLPATPCCEICARPSRGTGSTSISSRS